MVGENILSSITIGELDNLIYEKARTAITSSNKGIRIKGSELTLFNRTSRIQHIWRL